LSERNSGEANKNSLLAMAQENLVGIMEQNIMMKLVETTACGRN